MADAFQSMFSSNSNFFNGNLEGRREVAFIGGGASDGREISMHRTIRSVPVSVPVTVSAGKCPFGFHGDALRTAKRQNRAEAAGVAAGQEKLRTGPHAPAPSADPLKPPPIGDGHYEYLPFKVPYKMTMGLHPLLPNDWIQIDAFYAEEMAIRRELLRTHKETVLASMPGLAEEAKKELLDLLVEFLPARFPDIFALAGRRLTNRVTGDEWDLSDPSLDPLHVAALLVQEDLCLMLEVDGVMKFVAGAVLFPQGWQLLEKIGMDMHEIHKPVPLYEKEIGKSTAAFMQRLTEEKSFARANWSIRDDPSLYQPLSEEDVYGLRGGEVRQPKEPITAQSAGGRLFTRSERETLVRFPKTKAILFTIRTHVKPFHVFAGRSVLAQQFLEAIEALPAEVLDYKGIRGVYGPARDYLRLCAEGRPPGSGN